MYGLHEITVTRIQHSLRRQRAGGRLSVINHDPNALPRTPANSDLMVSLLSIGASELAVITALRLLQPPAREALDVYTAQRPLVSMETGVELDGRFAHWLTVSLHEQLQKIEAALESIGFEQVRECGKYSHLHFRVSFDWQLRWRVQI